METKIIIGITLIVIGVFIYHYKKSKFNEYPVYTNDSLTPSCDFTHENRIYPSGNIPGSYLGLSNSEKNLLFTRFVEYQDDDSNFTALTNLNN